MQFMIQHEGDTSDALFKATPKLNELKIFAVSAEPSRPENFHCEINRTTSELLGRGKAIVSAKMPRPYLTQYQETQSTRKDMTKSLLRVKKGVSLHLLHLIVSETGRGKYLKIFAKKVKKQYLCSKFFHFHSKPFLSPLLLKEQCPNPPPLSPTPLRPSHL